MKNIFIKQSKMQFSEILDLCYNTFEQNGEFTFSDVENIRKLAREAGLPNEKGVYIIYGLHGDDEKILDIGKSGTLKQDGSFNKQRLYGRLINGKKKKGLKRIDHYKNELNNPSLIALRIQWFVTYNEQIKIIPATIEADLLQAFYNDHKKLPDWNKKF